MENNKNKNTFIASLWKQAYLIEFRNGNVLEAAFTFAVPPESEEFTQGNRITETKTFGGLSIDDYGIDVEKIILSGSTINNQLKKIYGAGQADKYLSGEDEIYELKRLLNQYRSVNTLSETSSNKLMMLYDLSKIQDISSRASIAKRNYWRVFPGNFKIRRAHDKPFAYKYTIEFTGVIPQPESNNITKAPSFTNTDLPVVTGQLEGGLSYLKNILTSSDTLHIENIVGDKIGLAQESIEKFKDVTKKYDSILNGYAEKILDVTKESVGVGKQIYKEVVRFSLDLGMQFTHAALEVFKTVSDVTKKIRDIELQDIPGNLLNNHGVSAEQFKDTLSLVSADTEDYACIIAAVGKSSIPTLTVNVDEDGNDIIVPVYSKIATTVMSSTTFEGLAEKYYGDPAKSLCIAMYNQIPSESSINEAIESANLLTEPPSMDNNQDESDNTLKNNKSNENNFSSQGMRSTMQVRNISLSQNMRNAIQNEGVYSSENIKDENIVLPENQTDITQDVVNPSSKSSLNPGDKIQIPIFSQTNTNLNNLIYGLPEDLDNYGRDIKIKNKFIVMHNQDFDIVSGKKNIEQAILMRLQNNVNHRVRLQSYGIKNSIGDPVAGTSYLLSSIDETVNADPRVASIQGIEFKGIKDSILVKVNYTDIEFNQNTIIGGV